MKEIIIKFWLIGLLVFSLLGCLDDRIAPELNFQTESAIELLVYLESHGDYINSTEIDEFVSAQEVYANRNSYLIIDVRSTSDFMLGHIENANNVDPKNLLDFVKSRNISLYPKIVIISESGQSAAYYTALLKLDGYVKAYSMEYGMTAWHNDFASIWLDARRDFMTGPGESNYFTNEDFSKPPLTRLSQISLQNGSRTIKEKLEERINFLLAAGFNENPKDTSSFPKYNFNTLADEQASVKIESVYKYYNYLNNAFKNYFIICFGSNFLYKAHALEGPFASQGHLPSAVHYLPMMDLRSTNDLQTIPTNQTVAVYDVNGQVSAKIVAYLRLLGYDAKSILFGANTLFYSRVNWVESLRPFAFKEEMIMNLPYVTGN